MTVTYHDAIQLKGVSLSYDGVQDILRNLNFAIRPGEFVGVVGAPASGKTTFLNLIAGIIPHYEPAIIKGQIFIQGEDTQTLNLSKIAQRVGVVSQDPENQLFNLLVKDEVVWGLENRGYEVCEMEGLLTDTLAFFNISTLRERITYDLSGGEKQRVALAATYVSRPNILILDNPTSQLDPAGSVMVIESIKRILQGHQTVIMVEDKIDELLEHADRLLFLHNGEIVLDVPPKELGQHVEILHKIGIRLPEVIQLEHQLQTQGVSLGRMPLHMNDAVVLFRERLNGRSATMAAKQRSQSNTDTQLVISDVSFIYPPPRTIHALQSINLAVQRGSFLAIIGQNGSGKTTLARCVSGYLKPTHGKVTVNGTNVHQLRLQERVQLISYVFQNPDHQIFKDTVRKDVEFGPENLGWSAGKITEHTDRVLRMLSLDRYADIHPFRLSQGNRQRLAIASIAAMAPQILIIDEPTTGQDPVHARQVMDLLKALQAEGTTIIVVTHAMNLVGEYCDRVIALSDGQILIDDTPEQVFSHPEILEKTSVVPPPVAQLALLLGITPPPLTVDEAAKLFGELFSSYKYP